VDGQAGVAYWMCSSECAMRLCSGGRLQRPAVNMPCVKKGHAQSGWLDEASELCWKMLNRHPASGSGKIILTDHWTKDCRQLAEGGLVKSRKHEHSGNPIEAASASDRGEILSAPERCW